MSKFGVQFYGLQYHKKGFIKMHRVERQGPGQQSTSTVVEAYFETIPVFHESVSESGKAQQTQALINSVRQCNAQVNAAFCRALGKLLLDADWKATFG